MSSTLHIGRLNFQGHWSLRLTRGGVVISEQNWENLVTNVGENLALNATFGGSGSSFYMGLLSSGTPLETWLASNAASNDFTGYSEATLPTYTKNGSSTSQLISNSNNPATFNITSTGTVTGAFLVTNSSKSPTGDLFAAGNFSSEDVDPGDILEITASITA